MRIFILLVLALLLFLLGCGLGALAAMGCFWVWPILAVIVIGTFWDELRVGLSRFRIGRIPNKGGKVRE